MSRRVMIVSGESSGDRLGAGLAEALRKLDPGLRLEGMGGPRMEAAGVERRVDASRLGVTGVVEVLKRLGEYRAAFRCLTRRLEEDPPDVLVPVDYPDFNLRLAKVAARLGIPVIYFVSPQIWAWRRHRVRQIAETVDHMLVLFPFESRFYEEAGVPVTFVGHPMVERLDEVPQRAEARRHLGLPPEEPVVALLPGSRDNEVQRILPVMAAAAKRLSARVEGLRFVLPTAPGVTKELLQRSLAQGPTVIQFEEGYEELVRAADVAAVASGTATLETALLGTPMVVVYRLHPLTYLMGRLLVRVDHIAMPNLIADRRVVPELVQGECTPRRLAEELESLLRDEPRRSRMQEGLEEVHRRLAGTRPFRTAAEVVLSHLDREK